MIYKILHCVSDKGAKHGTKVKKVTSKKTLSKYWTLKGLVKNKILFLVTNLLIADGAVGQSSFYNQDLITQR